MRRETVTLDAGVVEYVDTGGPGPVVVLLHGALMDDSLWAEVVAAIAPDIRCMVPVLPMGAHRIPAPESADLSPRGLANLVGEFLEALDLREVTVVGNDTGGAIAQFLVAAGAARVGALALVSCDAFENFPPGLPGRTMALACKIPGMLRVAMLSLRIPALRRLPMTYGWMSKSPISNAVFTRWLDAYLADRRVRADVRRMMSGVDRRELVAAADRLTGFDRPALVVWAAEDRVMPVEHASRLVELLPSARLAMVDDSYTLIPLDRPRLLADLIAGFVAERRDVGPRLRGPLGR
jgi:pimeloyl-ACP methyl ester carboxylesterase